MIKDKSNYTILIIEDNPGDLYIFKEHLKDQIANPILYTAFNYHDAELLLLSNEIVFDIIFLDLSLPDKNGVDLINEIVSLSSKTPIVVLTGYSDIQFSIKSLHLGISDYLLKDEITSLTLYKSIRYNIERSKYIIQLEQSEKRYIDLFHLSPQPMWIYEIDTLFFLDVNEAAINNYGFSYKEFLSMTINDIRPKYNAKSLLGVANLKREKKKKKFNGFFRHQKKNGEIIIVEVTSNLISHNGKMVRIILANDITERLNYIKAIVEQNKNLKEIAWVQSHVVRAPLARLMGLIKVLQNDKGIMPNDTDFLFEELLKSANELDTIIREISNKASKIKINSKTKV
tara:strand:+ start:164 stop:1192 length:1029 start_codon:yes stop_codon:yes gene_type:complete